MARSVVVGKGAGALEEIRPVRDAVVAQLRAESTVIADRFADELQMTHPLYRFIEDADFIDRLRATSRAGVRAFVAWVSAGSDALDGPSRGYWEDQAREAAEQLVPLAALHEPVQLGTRHLYAWIVEACGPTSSGRATALALVEDLVAFEAVLTATLTDAYMAARFRADASERHLRREIIDNLLGGRELGPQLATRLAAGFGLEVDEPCVVLVAVPRTDVGQDGLEPAADILQHEPIGARRLMTARDGELVAVLPCKLPLDQVVETCRAAVAQLRRIHGIDLIVGVSSRGHLEEVPSRYQEAKAALKFAVSSADAVAAIPLVRIFDYLMTRVDATARRMVAPEVLMLVHEDERLAGVLTATLTALADNDLNVGRTAKQLFVHQNTVHYRLKRVRELTGFNPKRLHDLVDLLVQIRAMSPFHTVG